VNEEALAQWKGWGAYGANSKQNNILKPNWNKNIEQNFVQCITQNINLLGP